MQIQTRAMYEYEDDQASSQMMMMPSFASTSPPTPAYIQHPISKLDTLAGIAIKYGVEVADIRKVNGLVTDMQMFALKTLHIPLNGKHPPPSTTGHDNTEHSLTDNACCELFESFQPLRGKSSEQKLSPVMRALQGHYYGANPKMKKCTSEIFSLVEYEKRFSKCSENGSYYRNSPLSHKPLSRHQKSFSSATDISDRSDIMLGVAARKRDPDKRNGTLIRRNHKSEVNLHRIPELLLKRDNSSVGGFSTRSANGLAQRQKSTSRLALKPYSNQVV